MEEQIVWWKSVQNDTLSQSQFQHHNGSIIGQMSTLSNFPVHSPFHNHTKSLRKVWNCQMYTWLNYGQWGAVSSSLPSGGRQYCS